MRKVLVSFPRAWLPFRDSHAFCFSEFKYPLFRSFIWCIKHFIILSNFWENWKNLWKIEWKKCDRASIFWLQCTWKMLYLLKNFFFQDYVWISCNWRCHTFCQIPNCEIAEIRLSLRLFHHGLWIHILRFHILLLCWGILGDQKTQTKLFLQYLEQFGYCCTSSKILFMKIII